MQKTVVLAGNPNVGKSTLFNQLTGSHQKIANYPGVTVEKHLGFLTTDSGQQLSILDLPGTYSLNTKSEDEAIAARSIVGQGLNAPMPDVVVVVVEASKLQRSLLLALQIKKIHPQVILAVNMMDELQEFRMHLDCEKLSETVHMPVVSMTAKDGRGVCELITMIEKFPALDDKQKAKLQNLTAHNSREIEEEFRKINGIVTAVLRHDSETKVTEALSDRIDRIFLHPVFGPIIFVLMMMVLFQSLFTWSAPLMDGIDVMFSELKSVVQNYISHPILQSLICDGLISGVGSVLVFVPQIAITFMFIGLLEMTGYLARGAFLIDRLMRLFGLEGRAFIPLISSFACAIPGILSTRTLTDSRQRLITILVAPLMTCSARLPVYTLLISCFVPNTKILGILSLPGLTLFSLFVAGVLMAMVMALLFNRYLPKGAHHGTFLMELPRYRWPKLKVLYKYVSLKTTSFIKSAGSVIFVLSIILWAMAYFPRSAEVEQRYDAQRQSIATEQMDDGAREEKLAELEHAQQGESLRESYLGKLGRFIEPALAPMGFDWKLGIGVLASFAAREVFVSTMGIVFNLGETDEESDTLREKIQSIKNPDGTRAYTMATAFSLLIFFAFAAQCTSTLAAIKRETNSTRWALFAFGYLSLLAYVSATVVYQVMSCWG